MRASFQTGVTNKKIIRHAPNENNGITGSQVFYIGKCHQKAFKQAFKFLIKGAGSKKAPPLFLLLRQSLHTPDRKGDILHIPVSASQRFETDERTKRCKPILRD